MTANVPQPVAAQPMYVVGAAFAKTPACVDVLSFDPGLVNCGVTHLRVDTAQNRCCVLHTALLDVLHPLACFAYSTEPPRGRRRKPERVEPYSHRWPTGPASGVDMPAQPLSAGHVAALQRARVLLGAENLKDPDRVGLMPWTLHCVPWMTTTDVDVVLIEIQDPTNSLMRSVAHVVQSFFETRKAASANGTTAPRVEFVSARLKLSDPVLDTLCARLRFVDGEERQQEAAIVASGAAAAAAAPSVSGAIDRHNHDARKRSVNQVFEWLAEHRDFGREPHRFFAWARKQRAERHNVLDSLLQAWSWCLENNIGFEAGLLTDARRQRQRALARLRRQAQKRQRQEAAAAAQSASAAASEAPSAVNASFTAVQRRPPSRAKRATLTASSLGVATARALASSPSTRRRNARPVVPVEL